MKKWTMVNQRFASEGWVYPKRPAIKSQQIIFENL